MSFYRLVRNFKFTPANYLTVILGLLVGISMLGAAGGGIIGESWRSALVS